MDRARHVCSQCSRVINVTKGLSHAFAMEGSKFCTWCYYRLFFSERKLTGAVPYDEFMRVADPRFIDEALNRAVREGLARG